MCARENCRSIRTQEERGDAMPVPGNALSKPQLCGKVYFSYLCHGYKRLLNVGMGWVIITVSSISKADLCDTLAAHTL